nr:glycosyltransferase family 4 protein [Phaeovibrio sulfidiphilus]
MHDRGRSFETPTVLQVLPALQTGGVERGTVDVAAALVQQGWTSIVASSGGHRVRDIERAGALHITLPLESKNPVTIARNVARLKRVIQEHNVSLVHARSRAPAWSAWRATKALGIPFVTTFHGTYTLGPLEAKKAYNRVMTRGDRVIAISRFIASHIRDVYGIDESILRVIHRGVDTDVFSPGAVSQERMIQLARQWRIEDGVPVIMLPGRLTAWKGHRVMIDALALLNRPDVRAIFVGSDQGRTAYTESLQARARRLGVEDQILFAGDCRDMAAAYMLADVVASTSTRPEAFGRVVAEAQAMGRPVIAPDHGAAPEVIKAGATGWLTPPGDPHALAEALRLALDMDEGTRNAVAREAVAHIRANFSRKMMLDNTLHVYRELLMGMPPLPTALSFGGGLR